MTTGRGLPFSTRFGALGAPNQIGKRREIFWLLPRAALVTRFALGYKYAAPRGASETTGKTGRAL